MKNLYKLIGFIAIVAVMGFSMIACDNGGGDDNNNNNNNNNNTAPLLAGKFASQNGGTGDAVFFADYVSASRSVSRAIDTMSATEKELVGKIEDGDIIFNLRGVYDTSNNKFTLSAGSSFLVYQIAGTLTNGNMTSTNAEIRVKSGNEWSVHTVAVTSTTPDVTITGNASNEQVNGIPTRWFGSWKVDDPDYAVILKITSFDISADGSEMTFAFIDVTSLGNNKIEGITITFWYPNANPDGTVTGSIETHFEKFWIEETSNGLTLTMFGDSDSEDFAETKAFNTATASVTDDDKIHFVRP